MPSPEDPHAPSFGEQRRDLLVMLALGEPVDEWFDLHQRSCPQCQLDLLAYRDTVTLARESEDDIRLGHQSPPATVWAGISHRLGFDDGADDYPVIRPVGVRREAGAMADGALPEPSPIDRARHRSTGRWRIAVAAAAAVIAVGGGIGAGFAIGHSDSKTTASPRVLSQAQLSQQPGGPTLVSGAARVHTSPLGLAITVDTSGLPLRQGYYQVWLYDPALKHMLPVGALNGDGHGTFTVPAGVDLRTYDIVNISAQDYDGSYEHKQTVLQGPLTS